MNIRDHAKGKWPLIVSALLGEEFTDTRKHHFCPHDCTRKPSFRFSDKHGNGGYFCKCSDGKEDGFALLKCWFGMEFREACEKIESVIGKPESDPNAIPVDPPKMPRLAAQITARGRKIERSRYLESSYLEVAPGLLWMDKLDYYDSEGKLVGQFQAMCAPITVGDVLYGYHVTYLKDGQKVDLEPARKMINKPLKTGAGSPLYPAAEVMGIGEGIENCIAAHYLFYDMPVHSALNAELLSQWNPPPIAKKIHIFGDNDLTFTGQAATYKLAKRLVLQGKEVVIEIPPEPGMDWRQYLVLNYESIRAARQGVPA